MLTVVSSPVLQRGSFGKLHTTSAQYRSDVDLTGKLVRFTAAPFVANQFATPNNFIQWQLIYPSTETSMTFVGNPVNENGTVRIKPIDSKNFIIIYQFYWLESIDGYIGDRSFDNYGINYTAPNISNGFINLFVDIEGDSAIASHPIEQGACLEMIFDIGPLGGYKPGEDLTIGISRVHNPTIYNNYEVGLIRAFPSNTAPFDNDVLKGYGRAGNGVSAITKIDGTATDVSVFSSATGFVSNNIVASASVTIAGSALTSGNYYLYVVYDTPQGVRTCTSPVITQQANGRDEIFGTHSCSIEHNGTTYTSCCVSGLSNFGSTKVCITLDRSTFEAALAAAGYTGVMEDYFASAKFYASANEPSQGAIGSVTMSSYTFDSNGLSLCTIYSPSDSDVSRWYNAQFIFDYGGQGRDVINIVAQASYSGVVSNNQLLTTLNGVPIDDTFCCESLGQLNITSGNCDHYIGLGQTGYQLINLPYNIANLLCGQIYCIKSICTGNSSNYTIDDCDDAPPCPNLEIEITSALGPEDTVNIGIQNNLGISMQVSSDSCLTGLCTFNGTYITFTADVGFIDLDIRVIDINGCIWDIGYAQNFTSDFTDRVIYLPTTETQPNHNCVPQECTNNIDVNYSCENGVITYSYVENLTSPVATDVDDSQVLPDKVIVSRQVTFSDGCPPINIYQVIECIDDMPCVNDRTIEIDVDNNCMLLLRITDTFGSTLVTDKLYLKQYRDGVEIFNQEYDQVNSPYMNDLEVCYGDEIKVDTITAFDDGCIDLQISNPIYKHEPNQLSSRSITLSVVSGKLYVVQSDMLISPFVIDSDRLIIDINGMVIEYDQVAAPYANDIDVNDGDKVCVKAIVTPTLCCLPPIETEEVCIMGNGVINNPCDYSVYDINLSYANNTFSIQYTGDPMLNKASPMFPVFTLGNGINPLDKNDTGNPIVSSPFMLQGEGLLIVAWKIQLEGCEPKIITKYINGVNLNSCDNPQYIKHCDDDPLINQLRAINNTINACCDKCDCNISTQCTGVVNNGVPQYAEVSVTLTGDNCTGATHTLIDPNGAVVTEFSPGVYRITAEGRYIIGVQTADGCTDSIEYELNWPKSGGGNNTPPTFSPIPNV